ncbi:unnamed protein product [Prunus armeniaca]|uniref:Uncharacterized protein n=1 Tax=Prunus armeniaca TaxID=36596 RepID=A0A6J5XS98_PRUAR|nr:unnamed protein product [Prunus armeniaca]CAB4313914.1 unnamed protein product [Prunus armeniaca]
MHPSSMDEEQVRRPGKVGEARPYEAWLGSSKAAGIIGDLGWVLEARIVGDLGRVLEELGSREHGLKELHSQELEHGLKELRDRDLEHGLKEYCCRDRLECCGRIYWRLRLDSPNLVEYCGRALVRVSRPGFGWRLRPRAGRCPRISCG